MSIRFPVAAIPSGVYLLCQIFTSQPLSIKYLITSKFYRSLSDLKGKLNTMFIKRYKVLKDVVYNPNPSDQHDANVNKLPSLKEIAAHSFFRCSELTSNLSEKIPQELFDYLENKSEVEIATIRALQTESKCPTLVNIVSFWFVKQDGLTKEILKILPTELIELFKCITIATLHIRQISSLLL